MAPIRTALIGLSSTASCWAGDAHLPYLLSNRGRSRYEIIALCNSSVEAANAAIKKYELPQKTKAYGDPTALAADSDIELVVCCTRVDKHYDTVLPSIEAGKAIYLEWPLAHDMEHVRNLVSAARKSKIQTAVGIQGRYAPVIQKIREVVRNGRIGKVLSCEARASGVSPISDALPNRLKYFTEKAVGGNLFTIHFAHVYDQLQYALGDVIESHGHFQIQRPELKLQDPSTGAVTETVKTDIPDLIITSSSLPESAFTMHGATVLVRFRIGSPFPGEPALVWHIVGEKAEIQLAADSTTLQARGYDNPVTIRIRDLDSGVVEPLEWKWADWQDELPIPARSVGLLYEKFAEGDGVPSFDEALVRHDQLARLLSNWE